MKAPVTLSLVAVVALVLLFAAVAVVGAQNLHASATIGGTLDDNTACTPAPTARTTRTPVRTVAGDDYGGSVHAGFVNIPCITPSPSPSPVVGVTGRPTRTPRGATPTPD